MITFEARDTKAVAVDNGTDLRTWPIGSKNSMVRYIQTTGAEKFDLSATELGKQLFRKMQRASAKAAKNAEKLPDPPAEVKVEEPAPAPTTEVAADGMVERTVATSEGDSVTIVHPANPA